MEENERMSMEVKCEPTKNKPFEMTAFHPDRSSTIIMTVFTMNESQRSDGENIRM